MEEEKHDIVSNLPPEILLHIISLIPLKEAVRTIILSTAWNRSWIPLETTLELDSDPVFGHGDKLKQVLCKFLSSCENPRKLTVNANCPKDQTERETSILEDGRLVLRAIKGGDKELLLDFSDEKQEKGSFGLTVEPSCLSFCRRECVMKSSGISYVKTLHLRSVSHLNGYLVSALSSGFCVLENLKIEGCSGLEDIKIKANGYLQSFAAMDCPDLRSIRISAPSLRSFSYQGIIPTIQMKSPQNLVDVTLHLSDGLPLNEFDCEDVLDLLASVKDAQTLTISGWLLEWLCAAGVIFSRLEFQFGRLKELRWIHSSMDKKKLHSLACFLNFTPLLEKLVVSVDPNCKPIPCPYFHQYWHEPHLWMDYSAVKSNASQLKHLETVEMDGFTGNNEEDDQSPLVMDLLLHKAVTLKAMTVKSPNNSVWYVAKIPQSQLKLYSKGCCLKPKTISSPNKRYFFVLTQREEKKQWCMSGKSDI